MSTPPVPTGARKRDGLSLRERPSFLSNGYLAAYMPAQIVPEVELAIYETWRLHKGTPLGSMLLDVEYQLYALVFAAFSSGADGLASGSIDLSFTRNPAEPRGSIHFLLRQRDIAPGLFRIERDTSRSRYHGPDVREVALRPEPLSTLECELYFTLRGDGWLPPEAMRAATAALVNSDLTETNQGGLDAD